MSPDTLALKRTLATAPSEEAAARSARCHRFFWIVLGTAWVAAVLWGVARQKEIDFTPGTHGVIPITWPSDSAIALDAQKPTMMMTLHPRCPCSRASLEELS